MRNRLVTITLVFAMIASAIPSNAIQAAKKVKLNKTKLVLQVGKSYKSRQIRRNHSICDNTWN